MSKKIHWSDLTKKQKALIGTGCGAGKTAALIPQFIFKASCNQHDFYYSRGGSLLDKIEADVMFYAFMLKDINDGEYSFIKKLIYFKAASIYFVLVSVFGIFFFSFGKYKNIPEMIEKKK